MLYDTWFTEGRMFFAHDKTRKQTRRTVFTPILMLRWRCIIRTGLEC